jgi:uncharacterized protein YjbJ (UPF0337 family)
MMSVNLQKWEGRWEQLVGKCKTLIGELIANEHYVQQGECERVLGLHKEKVALSLEEFEETLDRRMTP